MVAVRREEAVCGQVGWPGADGGKQQQGKEARSSKASLKELYLVYKNQKLNTLGLRPILVPIVALFLPVNEVGNISHGHDLKHLRNFAQAVHQIGLLNV